MKIYMGIKFHFLVVVILFTKISFLTFAVTADII